MTNSIFVIAPYRWGGTWVFDDPVLGLEREPFVAGVPQMIDTLLNTLGIKGDQFRLTFSAQPFPGHQEAIQAREAESGGTNYWSESYGLKGWLCPALFHYFPAAPEKIYVRFDAA